MLVFAIVQKDKQQSTQAHMQQVRNINSIVPLKQFPRDSSEQGRCTHHRGVFIPSRQALRLLPLLLVAFLVFHVILPTDRNHPIFYASRLLGRPLIFGHRGGSKVFPENSLASFVDAQRNGADGVELDVFLTKDNEVVVFHDKFTKRLIEGDVDLNVMETNYHGNLSLLNFKKSLTYDRETLHFNESHPIALLKDVLSSFKGKRSKAGLPFQLNIELKPPHPADGIGNVGRVVANMIREHGVEEHCTVVSFDGFKVLQAKRAYPALHTGWQYADDLIAALGNANTWYEADGEETQPPADAQQSRWLASHITNALRYLMEHAVVDRLIGSTLVDLETVVLDDDTIQQFHEQNFAVGCFTFFPADLASVHPHPPADPRGAYEQGKRMLRRVLRQGVDWIETDSVASCTQAIHEIQHEAVLR
jgi:glycerophosphoryl diester phosphodiesterase